MFTVSKAANVSSVSYSVGDKPFHLALVSADALDLHTALSRLLGHTNAPRVAAGEMVGDTDQLMYADRIASSIVGLRHAWSLGYVQVEFTESLLGRDQKWNSIARPTWRGSLYYRAVGATMAYVGDNIPVHDFEDICQMRFSHSLGKIDIEASPDDGSTWIPSRNPCWIEWHKYRAKGSTGSGLYGDSDSMV